MHKIGVWPHDGVLQHPSVNQSSSRLDVIVDFLERKFCPIHQSPLMLHKEFVDPGGEYRRQHYICLHCPCKAEFVGRELKTDSILRTSDTIDAMVEEVKGIMDQQFVQDSSSEEGVEV